MGEEEPEQNTQNEQEVRYPTPILELPHHLGYRATQESMQAYRGMIEAMVAKDWSAITKAVKEYHAIAKADMEHLEGDDRSFAEIGLIIMTGLAWQRAGLKDSYEAELFNARIYANNMNDPELVRAIEFALRESEERGPSVDTSLGDEMPTGEIIAICKNNFPTEVHEELDSLVNLPPDEALEEIASLVGGYDLAEDAYELFNRLGISVEFSEPDYVEPKEEN